MNHRVKPFLIVGVFWVALFMFVLAGYSGTYGLSGITGFAVNEQGAATPLGYQSMAIIILFFTNILTLFFYVREIATKK